MNPRLFCVFVSPHHPPPLLRKKRPTKRRKRQWLMVRFTLLTIFDECNFGDCDFSFLLTSQPPLISFSKKWWHLPFFPAVKFAEADKMSVLERSGLCHSEATNIGHLEKSYLAGGTESTCQQKEKNRRKFFLCYSMDALTVLSQFETLVKTPKSG